MRMTARRFAKAIARDDGMPGTAAGRIGMITAAGAKLTTGVGIVKGISAVIAKCVPITTTTVTAMAAIMLNPRGASAIRMGSTMAFATVAPVTASGQPTTITTRMPIADTTGGLATRATTNRSTGKVIGRDTSKVTTAAGDTRVEAGVQHRGDATQVASSLCFLKVCVRSTRLERERHPELRYEDALSSASE